MPGIGGADSDGLFTALGLRRGEAAEVLHQHLMARSTAARPAPHGFTEPATSGELLQVLRNAQGA